MLCNTLLQPAISVWSGLELQFVVFSLVCFRPFACCGRMPFFFFNMLSGRESSRHFVLNKKQLNIVSLYNVLGVHYHLGTLDIFFPPFFMSDHFRFTSLDAVKYSIFFTGKDKSQNHFHFYIWESIFLPFAHHFSCVSFAFYGDLWVSLINIFTRV